MKQQVLIIHGGHRAGRHPQLIQYLRGARVSLDDLRFRGWKANLHDSLGKKYEIFNLKIPNPQTARYEEWKLWFEKFYRLLENPILIGHSLGGVFLAKYLSEEKIAKKVRAAFLVAAPYFEKGEFALSKNLRKLLKRKVFLYHSKDD